MKEVLKFWWVIALIVGGVGALVATTMGLMIWMGLSEKAAGFVWCGFMFAGIIIVFSKWILDDQEFQHELARKRQLGIIQQFYSHHL